MQPGGVSRCWRQFWKSSSWAHQERLQGRVVLQGVLKAKNAVRDSGVTFEADRRTQTEVLNSICLASLRKAGS